MIRVDSAENVANEEGHWIAVDFISTWTIFGAVVDEHSDVEGETDCGENTKIEIRWALFVATGIKEH